MRAGRAIVAGSLVFRDEDQALAGPALGMPSMFVPMFGSPFSGGGRGA
ncbi:hypothetical protein [Sphaerisporangium aureirubrum]|uniref:Uncharacterized protein n=1 Tax=Sphaerisporangium aureirubrum TaxID=1544736 RepID=A0ABW1NLW4_9ACTN